MTISATLSQKEARFLSAPKFAVVGASATNTKNGFKAFKYLVDHHKDVVPINPTASEIQGVKCLKALSELPDPTHTALSIVVHPEVTLEILQQAKALGIFALWLQPGAEDDAVIKFIEADAQFEERCVYRARALHSLPGAAVAAITLHEDTSAPCMFKEPSAEASVTKPAVATQNAMVQESTIKAAGTAPTFEQKKARFLSAPRYAVVGASASVSKNGNKAVKWLVEQHKDVVPVNLKAAEIQGIKCIKALSELPDPTHTSVSVVVQPKVTLDILKQAKALGIFALWLQPGAEDDAVVEFIEADAQFAERCIYRTHALHSLPVHAMAAITLHQDTSAPCLFQEPSTVSTVPPVVAPPALAPVVAGVKHAISPPSTPPAAKSLKLSPEESTQEAIPGLA